VLGSHSNAINTMTIDPKAISTQPESKIQDSGEALTTDTGQTIQASEKVVCTIKPLAEKVRESMAKASHESP
jgi:hypothetical protein